MWWSSLWQSAMRFFRSPANGNETLPLDAVDALRIARHEKFCTALPFPELDWTNDKATTTSLADLRDYAEQLANSALDWYLDKKTSKKRFAVVLHYLIYFFGILGVFIPLLKIGPILELPFIKHYFGANAGANAAELALLFLGIAGGFNLIDRQAGFTADWMRYITTASRINRALVEFQFEWNKLDRNSPCSPDIDGPKRILPPAKKGEITDPVEKRIALACQFCMRLFELMGQETSIWADELKERVAQMARQLSPPGRS